MYAFGSLRLNLMRKEIASGSCAFGEPTKDSLVLWETTYRGGNTVTSEKMRDFFLEYFTAKAAEDPAIASALAGSIAVELDSIS